MIKQREELEKRTKEHKLLSVTKAYHRDEITETRAKTWKFSGEDCPVDSK